MVSISIVCDEQEEQELKAVIKALQVFEASYILSHKKDLEHYTNRSNQNRLRRCVHLIKQKQIRQTKQKMTITNPNFEQFCLKL